ncbi:MAG: ABC transporter permease [Dehalococcoidia bacterium]|nr:ABC transporter permease [Dehalococcoidia bacterium]
MWQHRELIWNLTVVDLKNRYQNTALGFFWSLLSPLLQALVLYFVFRHLWGREVDFAINLLVGIMAWQFFATGTSSALRAIVGNANLVTRLYIPRQILVLSNALSTLVNSLLTFIVLLPIIFVLLGHLPVTVLLFLLIHLVLFWFIYGAGLFLSSLFVYFRDVTQIWEVLVRVLFFCSPIFYPLSIIPASIMPYYRLNPITQFIEIYRDVMVAGDLPSLFSIVIVGGFTVAAYLVGSLVFGKLQRRFAEEL